MTETTATSKVEANVVKPDFMLTKTGVVILGAERIGDKLAGLVCKMIEAKIDSGISLIEFRTDNFPQDSKGPVLGMAFADVHSCAVNLEHCWHLACKEAHKGEENLSMLGMLWLNVLLTVGHELEHLNGAESDREAYELLRLENDGEELEKVAHESAMELMIDIARKFDVEIPDAGEMGWFGVKLMDLFTKDSTKDLDWVKKLQTQMGEGIVFEDGVNDPIKSMRQFIQMAHASDENWSEQGVLYVNLMEEMGGDLVKVSLADAPSVVETAEEIVQEEVVEGPAVVNPQQQLFATVAPAPEDDVVVEDDGGNEVETVIANPEDIGMTQAEVASAPTPQPVVETAPAATPDELTLPLPETVLAEQQANVPPSTEKETPTTYPEPYFPMDAMAPVLERLWRTLHHHIFTKCGWKQNPQTGVFGFDNAAAVLEWVDISKIIASAPNFIMECDGQSAVGAGLEGINCSNGMIKGHVSSKQNLPMYTVYLNINGNRIKRTLVANNPLKTKADGSYTNPALEGQRGHMISWVYKGEGDGSKVFSERCAVKIRDNDYEVIR